MIDAFLQIWTKQDRLKGEAFDARHVEEIQLKGFDFGNDNSDMDERLGQTKNGAGRWNESGGYSFAKIGFSIEKEADIASPTLFDAYCKMFRKDLKVEDKVFPNAQVTLRKATGSGDAPLEFVVFRFSNVVVTSYRMTPIDSGTMKEEVDFRFTVVTIKYRRQEKTGAKGTTTARTGWNFQAHCRETPQ